jgi:hypothetical protein
VTGGNMRKIILEEENCNTVKLSDINIYSAIFAKRDGIIVGMIIEESAGWILRIGNSSGATGHHPTIEGCMQSCSKKNYEFFV